MLGAAGLGKTYELAYLAGLDRERALDVRIERLAVLGQTPDGLASQLVLLAEGATENTVLYLDALDEVMVPVKTTGLIVARWVRDTLAGNKPKLRISCRSAVWPPGVEAAIREVYGEEECAFALLQPLSLEDVKSIASARGLDAEAFTKDIEAAGALVLAQQPLTLGMLLRVHVSRGSLPASRSALFAQGVELLASESAERLDDGTAMDVPLAELMDAAERLACFSLLSGRDVVDLGDLPSSSSLGKLELASLPGGSRPLDVYLVRAVGRCGLCEGDGPRRFRFAHRQFAEYLAGRRLARLLPHQARALLSSGLGWQAGVAGPLRETAAFAAMESTAIASWVTDHDPEVVGLSDVADDTLRKRATLNLLAKFRRHELTDSQVGRDGIELAGFCYEGAGQDLRPVLKERGGDCEDVLECAVALIQSWGLVSMSDDLADLVLDVTAPQHTRTSAGYALAKVGTAGARRRLLPLTAGGLDNPDFELKGLALRCNWPDGLTVPELLAAVTQPRASRYYGAYESFIFALDHEGFEARGHRLAGLAWARQFVRRQGDAEATVRIARRIAIASLDEIDEPGVAEALTKLILDAAEAHVGSPLEPPRRFSLGMKEPENEPPVLAGKPAVRRKLIDALAAYASKDRDLWWTARGTPGLLVPDDFPWLLQQATNLSLPMSQRENYAELARMLPWSDSIAGVEAWLAARETEPVASRFPYPLSIELESEEAARAKKAYADTKRWNRPTRHKKLRPPPAERLEQALRLSETKDPRFFLNVCRELTLEEYSTHYGFSRFLTNTPGWAAAEADTRRRIVESAKRLLSADTDEPERGRTEPLNTILPGYMSAIWLVMECEPTWVESLPASWWQRWAWYILRELNPNMVDEPEESKNALLRKLHERAPAQVRGAVEELATSAASDTQNLFTSILGVMNSVDDAELDAWLCAGLEAGEVPEDRVGEVAQFVLSRNSDRALVACLSRIEPAAVAKSEAAAVRAAVALLHERTRDGWASVFELLRRRPDLARNVLGEFAHGGRLRWRREGEPAGLAKLAFAQIGQLVSLLLEAFPPESDAKHQRGAHFMGPDDSARQTRDQLISWLGDQRDVEAAESLRTLEERFGTKYPWLRRPRARAERAYRLSRWVPIPPRAVAELLAANGKRLIRSGRDAMDGVVAAIEDYAKRLRHDSPNDLEDLWNRRRDGGVPTPKDEERVSDKLCAAVRQYFRDFAVGAEREVQIFRRKLPSNVGGAPGSEVDVLYRVPAAGIENGEAIAVPIEVKLSHNVEARTGLRDQLVGRYMSELGTNLGVFVVAWMGTPPGYRPLWGTPELAKEDLQPSPLR
jgi:hypothetical protein